jgi:hypothetical protein
MPDDPLSVVIQNKLAQLVLIGITSLDGTKTETKRLGPGEKTEAIPLARVSSYTHHLAHLGHVTIRAC